MDTVTVRPAILGTHPHLAPGHRHLAITSCDRWSATVSITGRAVGLSRLWKASRCRHYAPLAVLLTLALFYPMVAERGQYLSNNAKWGKANRDTAAANRPFVEAALKEAQSRGGRAYAGLAAGWGASFKLGELPFYAYLSEARVPTLGFLFHSMALTSDIMVRFDERNPFHYRLFNVNTVIAPDNRGHRTSTSRPSGRRVRWRS